MYYLGKKLHFRKDDIQANIINSFKHDGSKYVVLIDNNLSAESILSIKFRSILKILHEYYGWKSFRIYIQYYILKKN